MVDVRDRVIIDFKAKTDKAQREVDDLKKKIEQNAKSAEKEAGKIKKAFRAVGVVIGGVGRSIEMASNTMTGLKSSFDMARSAIDGVANVLRETVGRSEEAVTAWDNMSSSVMSVFTSAFETSGVLGDLTDDLGVLAEDADDTNTAFGRLVRDGFSTLVTGTTYVMQGLMHVASGLSSVVTGMMEVYTWGAKTINRFREWSAGNRGADAFEEQARLSEAIRFLEENRPSASGVMGTTRSAEHQELLDRRRIAQLTAQDQDQAVVDDVLDQIFGFYTENAIDMSTDEFLAQERGGVPGLGQLVGVDVETTDEAIAYLNQRIESLGTLRANAGGTWQEARDSIAELEQAQRDRRQAHAERVRLIESGIETLGEYRDDLNSTLQGEDSFITRQVNSITNLIRGIGDDDDEGGGGGGRRRQRDPEATWLTQQLNAATAALYELDQAAGSPGLQWIERIWGSARGQARDIIDAPSPLGSMAERLSERLGESVGSEVARVQEQRELAEDEARRAQEVIDQLMQSASGSVINTLGTTLDAMGQFVGGTKDVFKEMGLSIKTSLGGIFSEIGKSALASIPMRMAAGDPFALLGAVGVAFSFFGGLLSGGGTSTVAPSDAGTPETLQAIRSEYGGGRNVTIRQELQVGAIYSADESARAVDSFMRRGARHGESVLNQLGVYG